MQQQGVERRDEGREGVRRVRKDRRKDEGQWKKEMEWKMQQEGRQK